MAYLSTLILLPIQIFSRSYLLLLLIVLNDMYPYCFFKLHKKVSKKSWNRMSHLFLKRIEFLDCLLLHTQSMGKSPTPHLIETRENLGFEYALLTFHFIFLCLYVCNKMRIEEEGNYCTFCTRYFMAKYTINSADESPFIDSLHWYYKARALLMRWLLDFRGPFVSDWRDQMCRDNI